MTTILLRRDFWREWVCLGPLAIIMIVGGLAFGGNVWWFRPLAIAGVGLSIGGGLLRLGWRRDRLFLASPLLPLGMIALAWAFLQCVPLPRAVVGKVAPLSESVLSRNQLPPALSTFSTGVEASESPVVSSRIPISLTRAETVRRALWLALGLGVFWFVGRWVDRSSKLLVITGFVICIGAINSTILTLQLLDGSEGYFGLITPDRRYFVGPGYVDILASPHRSELDTVDGISAESGYWTIHRPTEVELLGIMPGGLVSYGCLQIVSIPLGFGCLCFMAQRRGSRFTLKDRLRDRGITTLWCAMIVLGILSSALVGITVPQWVALPIGLGLAVTAFYAIRSDLEWWVPVLVLLIHVGAFIAGQRILAGWTGTDDSEFQRYWKDQGALAEILRENREIWNISGWTGIGLGAYSLVTPYVKSTVAVSSEAISSLARWVLELGFVLVTAICLAAVWVTFRLLRGFRHVGYEQRCLLGMTLGTFVALSFGFCVSPGWDNPLLFMIACSLFGVADRTLCGASDLLMESWDEA